MCYRSEMTTLDCISASFEEWITAVFAHPVGHNAWYLDVDFLEPSPQTGVDYVTRLFNNPRPLEEYLDKQVAEGLQFIISNGCSNHMINIYDDSVPLDGRVSAIESIKTLFTEYLLAHCSSHLSHLDEPGASELNSICYMWWDTIPLYGRPTESGFNRLDATVLAVMEHCLALPSVACQESALHGLGHWHSAYPQEVERIIDGFSRTSQGARPELLRYAQSARSGCIN